MNEEKQCGWCRIKEYDRFECSLINKNGSDLVVDNIVVTCIAKYCPMCGRCLTGGGGKGEKK